MERIMTLQTATKPRLVDGMPGTIPNAYTEFNENPKAFIVKIREWINDIGVTNITLEAGDGILTTQVDHMMSFLKKNLNESREYLIICGNQYIQAKKTGISFKVHYNQLPA